MTLVFDAVGLPKKYIGVLLTVDWFLDRCRTTINVMGDRTWPACSTARPREVRPSEPAGGPTIDEAPMNELAASEFSTRNSGSWPVSRLWPNTCIGPKTTWFEI